MNIGAIDLNATSVNSKVATNIEPAHSSEDLNLLNIDLLIPAQTCKSNDITTSFDSTPKSDVPEWHPSQISGSSNAVFHKYSVHKNNIILPFSTNLESTSVIPNSHYSTSNHLETVQDGMAAAKVCKTFMY